MIGLYQSFVFINLYQTIDELAKDEGDEFIEEAE